MRADPAHPRTVDRHIYFVHAMPDDQLSVSLPELHQILADYIARNDDEMAELRKEREERAWRKGEGKTKREVELDNAKEADESEYRSGFGTSHYHFVYLAGFLSLGPYRRLILVDTFTHA